MDDGDLIFARSYTALCSLTRGADRRAMAATLAAAAMAATDRARSLPFGACARALAFYVKSTTATTRRARARV